MSFRQVAVVGAGTMGHGIAQIAAMAGAQVVLTDVSAEVLARGLGKVKSNLDKGVEKGKLGAEEAAAAWARLSGIGALEAAVEGADLVIEAVPERLQLKQDLLSRIAACVDPGCILGTNTSSLSVARIAQAVPRPERLLGTHFFNPVHIMALLELVHHVGTAPEVMARVKAWGEAMGKTCIVVRDSPGFATSRLGVCLGMEAIRMLQEGVASAEDIDQAMVLGYRHPVGPLRLSDMVGLDVRLQIGEYLARELGNAAFEPPELMRQMVAEGKLGQKTGQGFYRWS